MEVRHLRYFVAVAEERHFGRAARRLHMTQPPLSARIADLERALGVRLFDRTPRGATLTAAGLALLPRARRAVTAFDHAITSTAARPRWRITLTPETSAAVITAISAWCAQHDQDAEVTEATTAAQLEMFSLGVPPDIALLHLPQPSSRQLVTSVPLTKPLGVLMPAAHDLARRQVVQLQDLGTQPLVIGHRHMSPWLYDHILGTCRAAGYRPSQVIEGVREVPGLLLANHAVALTPRPAPRSDVTWRPLASDPPLHWRIVTAWARGTTTSRKRAARTALLTALTEHDGWQRQPATPGVPAKHPASSVNT
jgi:DNA-binding transcriptional LysR family regulator